MSMIVNEHIVDFIHSLQPERSALLEEIRTRALAEGVPIIRDETADFLACMVALRRPGRILEIGTAVGYSALLMAEQLPADGQLWTIEKYPPRLLQARENLARSERASALRLLEGDAEEWLQRLTAEGERFDFIFMDAAKGQYIRWLPYMLMLMSDGAVLLSDNILQEGSLADSRFVIPKRDRTIHSRMRAYLYELKHHPQLQTAVLPLGDGVAMSVKTGGCV